MQSDKIKQAFVRNVAIAWPIILIAGIIGFLTGAWPVAICAAVLTWVFAKEIEERYGREIAHAKNRLFSYFDTLANNIIGGLKQVKDFLFTPARPQPASSLLGPSTHRVVLRIPQPPATPRVIPTYSTLTWLVAYLLAQLQQQAQAYTPSASKAVLFALQNSGRPGHIAPPAIASTHNNANNASLSPHR